MKNLIIFSALIANTAFAQETVELKLPRSNKITMKFMFRNGSICDPKGKEGLTFLTSRLMTEGGTKEFTSAQIKDMIFPWAAEFSSSVDKEVSVFTFEVHKDFLTQFYPLVKGMMLTPAFSEEDFSRVKSNQQNYVDQVVRAQSDEEYSKKALEDFLFRGTNYQHMIQGKTESVKSITRDDVKAHYENFFTANNVMIGISGSYTAEFLAMLQADAKKLSSKKPEIPAAGKGRQPNGIEVEIIAKEGAFGSAIFTGFPMDITRSNDEFAALMIANSWLGEHRKSYSRLYQKIREQRSMNYGSYSYIEWYENGGSNMLPVPGVPRSSNYFSIWIRPVQIAKNLKQQYPELGDVKIGHAHFALRMALKEMQRMLDMVMIRQEFDLTKQFLRSYIKLYAQTPSRQLGYLMDSRFYGREDYLKELDVLLSRVTLEDMQNTIRKYWQTKNMFITIVTDKSEAEPLAESLKNGFDSHMTYSDALKAVMDKELLMEDGNVAGYPMIVTSVKIIDSKESFR